MYSNLKKIVWFSLILGAHANAAYFPTVAVNNFNALGVYNLTPPTLTDGQTDNLQLSSSGQLLVADTALAADIAALSAQLPASLGSKLSAASLSVVFASDSGAPLPTGAATAALQTTGNTSLSDIDTSTAAINTKIPAEGSATTANSLPVNIASDQVVPVSAASLPLPTGAATSANQTSAQTSLTAIATSTASVDSKFPAKGAAVTANSVPVNIASDQVVPVSGTVTAAPPSYTAFITAGGSSASLQSFTAPANAKWVLVQGDQANTANIRFGSSSISTTSGMLLAPGQDSGLLPVSAGFVVSAIAVTGTQAVNITWIY